MGKNSHINEPGDQGPRTGGLQGTWIVMIFVTRFVKRGLPHTSNLPILMINTLRLVQAIELKLGQRWVPP